MTYYRPPQLPDLTPQHATLWRYTTYERLADLLRRRCAFFTRLGHMADEEDEFEGQLSPLNFAHPEIEVEHFLNNVFLPSPPNPLDLESTIRRQFGDLGYLKNNEEWRRQHVYVNCWREDNYESREMWDYYTRHGEGVVVRTSTDALRRSFASAPGHQLVFRVYYYDPAHVTVHVDHILAPLFKRKSFETEREVRAYIVNTEDLYTERTANGIFVPIIPEVLVHEVRTSPDRGTDLVDRVTDLVASVGLNVRVMQSLLASA